jgi:hypothetical protein
MLRLPRIESTLEDVLRFKLILQKRGEDRTFDELLLVKGFAGKIACLKIAMQY